MRKIAVMLCAIVMTILSVFATASAGGLEYRLNEIKKDNGALEKTSNSADLPLASTKDFVYDFNFYGAFMGNGHELSIENTSDFEKLNHRLLFKTIFNDCEILSLWLTEDAKQVLSVSCTWASSVRNSDKYLEDFLWLLSEAFLASGAEANSLSDLYAKIGEANAFNVGSKGEMTIGGVSLSYETTSYSGTSFKMEHK
ncbi:MAG: hypothetical protein IJ188_06565 [Clostridia bacterium]|nr:hypothetical protein [Clostridia bacterium]